MQPTENELPGLGRLPPGYQRYVELFDQLALHETVSVVDILKQFYGRLCIVSAWFMAGFAVFFLAWNLLSAEKMSLAWWAAGPEMLLLFVFSASVVVGGLCLFLYPAELGWQKDLDLTNPVVLDAYDYYQQHMGEMLLHNKANQAKHAAVTGLLCVVHLIIVVALFPPPLLL